MKHIIWRDSTHRSKERCVHHLKRLDETHHLKWLDETHHLKRLDETHHLKRLDTSFQGIRHIVPSVSRHIVPRDFMPDTLNLRWLDTSIEVTRHSVLKLKWLGTSFQVMRHSGIEVMRHSEFEVHTHTHTHTHKNKIEVARYSETNLPFSLSLSHIHTPTYRHAERKWHNTLREEYCVTYSDRRV